LTYSRKQKRKASENSEVKGFGKVKNGMKGNSCFLNYLGKIFWQHFVVVYFLKYARGAILIGT